MKKIILLIISLFVSSISQSQILSERECIGGPRNIETEEIKNYTSINSAQCSNCYHWDVSDSSIINIVGNNTNNSVAIEGISAGNATLNLTYFTGTSCKTCSINITVEEGDCYTIERINYVEPVSFLDEFDCPYKGFQFNIEPTPPASFNYTYEWTITRDGEVLNYTTEMPQVASGCLYLEDSGITEVNVEISSTVRPECYDFKSKYYGNDGLCNNDDNDPANCFNNPTKVDVFPNPANDQLNINFKNNTILDRQVIIKDISGLEILNYSLPHKQNQINTSNFDSGVYFFRVVSNNEITKEGKFIKK